MNSSYLFNMNQHDRSAKKGKMNSEVTDETLGPRSKQVMVSLNSVLSRPHLDDVRLEVPEGGKQGQCKWNKDSTK